MNDWVFPTGIPNIFTWLTTKGTQVIGQVVGRKSRTFSGWPDAWITVPANTAGSSSSAKTSSSATTCWNSGHSAGNRESLRGGCPGNFGSVILPHFVKDGWLRHCPSFSKGGPDTHRGEIFCSRLSKCKNQDLTLGFPWRPVRPPISTPH